MKTLILISTFFFSILNSNAATCVSLGDGAWDNPATWSCGAVPSAGDSVVIAVGHTVTISTTEILSGAPFILVIQGTFLFDHASAKLHLPCGSIIYIEATGSIQSSGVGVPSHNIKICNVTVWEGKDGTLTGPVILTGPTPLPVSYIGAELNATNGEWSLSWLVASEQNNDYFLVDYSQNGESWELLEEVSSIGNHTEMTEYTLNLGRLQPGKNYLRISQQDKNGELNHLQILSTEIEAMIKVYPNPASKLDPVTLNLSELNEDADIIIVGMDGRKMQSFHFDAKLSPDYVLLENTNLQRGTYMVIIAGEKNKQSIPLVIQ